MKQVSGYQCQDCGYQSSKGFPGGRCPGCGSFRIVRLDGKTPPTPAPARLGYRVALLIALWLLLAYEIWSRLLH